MENSKFLIGLNLYITRTHTEHETTDVDEIEK